MIARRAAEVLKADGKRQMTADDGLRICRGLFAALASAAATLQLAIAANLELLVQFCVSILICSLLLFKLIPGLRRGGSMRCGTLNLFVLHGRISHCTVVTDVTFWRRRTKTVPRNGATRYGRVAAPGCAATRKRKGK